MAIDNDKTTGFMSALWQAVSGFFDVGFNKVWTGLQPNIITAYKGVRNFIKVDWKTHEQDTWNKMLSVFERDKLIDDDTKKQLIKLRDLPKGGDVVSYFVVFLLLTLKQVTTWSGVIGSDIRRELNIKHRPVDVSAGEVIPAAFLDPEKIPLVKKILTQLGIPDEQIDLMFLSFHRGYDEGTIRSLYFREIINEKQVYERMKVIGYTKERTAEIMQTWPVIPSLGDIVRYIAKEAFEPKMIKMFGLMEDYPVEAEEWAKKQGLSKRWVEAEWVAHWRDLGIDFMLEAFHRHIVEWDFVERYMALIEIPPALRNVVKLTAFNVFTRVDVRRMHDIGVLTDGELIVAYQDQGYDENKATKMAEFTIRYNKQHERDLTKSEIIKGYAERLIAKRDALAMLIDMEYSESEADYLLTYEDFKFDKKLQTKKINAIQFRFTNNFITESEATTQLNALALQGKHIQVLIEEWQIDIFQDQKIPSKTDLDKFIKAKIIDQTIYTEEMFKLGYNTRYIDWYWRLISGK
ncbi:hypothetical protein LCGC14_0888530 [marine sediment metagenome]|uniref:Uncharacterized protein n=1 Tax=marine sediment metagenome TaxID=412755 RepID=A0A0F9NZY7_9ZZZZ